MDTITGGPAGFPLFVYLIREWLLLYDSPRNLTILPWCTMRSMTSSLARPIARNSASSRFSALARQHTRGDRHVHLATSHVAVEHEVLGSVHETEVHELLAPPVDGERAMPQSYPSKPLTHGITR